MRCLVLSSAALFVVLLAIFGKPSCVLAQQSPAQYSDPDLPIELGEEYQEYRKARPGMSAPGKKAKSQPKKSSRSSNDTGLSDAGYKALMYLPNRIVDFIDIFRVDVGIGPSAGGVVRLSEYGQAGYRNMFPGSLRVGLHGREVPVFVEEHDEYGVGPWFHRSSDRKVTPVEVGAGVDLLVVGAYLGVSIDEAVDFVLGIFCIDTSHDDF